GGASLDRGRPSLPRRAGRGQPGGGDGGRRGAARGGWAAAAVGASVRRAVSFLTPFGGATTPSPAALEWFPVVGAAIGLVLGGWWWLVDRAWSNAVSAGLVVAADLALTGMLHLDGLADTADGLLPALPR